jgi:DNA polymerase IV (DinB-like DNA polymerase)
MQCNTLKSNGEALAEGLTRLVGHLDLDYFYAQVEELENPSLRNLPVLVCVYSGRTEDSGVVSTANYRARELGVRSGIPIASAKKRLAGIEAAFIRMDREKYEGYSERVMEILRENVDVMEQTGIDEAFFDITKRSGGSFEAGTEMASIIKSQILQRERLTCSVGIAPTKISAKLASDFKKPDGLTVVRPSELADFMEPMLVEKLYGIGDKTAKALQGIGVVTIGDLARKDIPQLDDLFGQKMAVYLHTSASGEDDEPVQERGQATQISRIITLKRNSRDPDEILTQLAPALDYVQRRVVEEDLFFRSISVIGILSDLSIKTRTKTLEAPTSDSSTLNRAASELLGALVSELGDLRRVGIKVADFEESKEQSSLSEFLR